MSSQNSVVSRSSRRSGISKNSISCQIIDDFSCSQLSNAEASIQYNILNRFAGSENGDETQFSINHIIQEELVEFTPMKLNEEYLDDDEEVDEIESVETKNAQFELFKTVNEPSQISSQISTQMNSKFKGSYQSLETCMQKDINDHSIILSDKDADNEAEQDADKPNETTADHTLCKYIDLSEEALSYPDILMKEIFEPNQPWEKYKKNKDNLIQTRISERGLLVCHSKAQIDRSAEELKNIISNYETRKSWDQNCAEGYLAKQLQNDVEVHYFRTQKVAVVAPRDQYLVLFCKTIEASESPSGNKLIVVGAKSKDFEEYPEKKGIVRASTYITGWCLEEVSPNMCDVHYMIESDFKLSLFLQKSSAPKACNYTYALKQYIKELDKKSNKSK